MALYSKLSVVNRGLAALGQLPVNDLETPHPGVPAILQALETANITVQTRRYWFNQETTTLTPDPNNSRITIPNDVAAIESVDKRVSVSQRGRYLYNNIDGTFELSAPVEVEIHRVVTFDDLPASAAHYVATKALEAMQSGLEGDGVRFRQLADERDEAFRTLTAEDTRQRRFSLLNRQSAQLALYRINQDSQDPFRRP